MSFRTVMRASALIVAPLGPAPLDELGALVIEAEPGPT
jgi:hypothetical protein